ncbi:MAG: quinone-dependent dihydroorotate dehydrogenase [Sphingomicrobium sp.]
MYSLLRPLMFRLDAERAHRATIASLKLLPKRRPPSFDGSLTTSIAGLGFPSPVGLAAGFDKDAEVSAAMLGLGFGFVEIGTVTPLPQPGNAKPRLFRLVEDRAVINRLGFNNRGQAAVHERLAKRDRSRGVVGINIGANKDSPDRIADYAAGVRSMAPLADYLTINISSPNTPGLRQLQDEGALRGLLAAVQDARGTGGPPVFLKVAPDLGEGEPDQIVRVALNFGVDALIVANTTISRPALRSSLAAETGGLSGRPLRPLALDALRRFRGASGGALPLIAVGGIENAEDAMARIRAGASLVQLYSAMVYHGPGLALQIARDLTAMVAAEGMANISDAVGLDA